jgi:DNA polymerase-3 subunit alpha
MDKFGKRAAMLSALDKIRTKGVILQKVKANGQTSIFDQENPQGKISYEDELPEMEEFTHQELLSLEKDLLGFYLTSHPLTTVLSLLAQERSHKIYDLGRIEKKGELVKVGGVVSSLRIVFTKAQAQEMAFARIEDETGSIETIVFPKVYSRTKGCWVKDRIVLLKGRVELREERQSLVVDDVWLLEEKELEPRETTPGWDFEVTIPSQMSPRKLVELNKLLKQNQGKNKIALVFIDNLGRTRRMILPFGVDYSKELEKKIKEIIKE